MADASVAGQSPDAPELVEILKRLAKHRQGAKVIRRGNLDKISGELLEALKDFNSDAARGLLCRFIDAAGVECRGDSLRRMLANLDCFTEVRLASLASGFVEFRAMFADLGPEAERAFDFWRQLCEQPCTREESDAYWHHPLVLACRWLEQRLGIKREDLEAAAFRLTTPLGLRGMDDLPGPSGTIDEGQPDWLWMIPKFRELDRDGTTAKLWQSLLNDYSAILTEAGLVAMTAGRPDEDEGNGGAGSPSPPAAKPTVPEQDTKEPLLCERNQLVLIVLRDGQAVDSDHRIRTSDIAVGAAGRGADPNQYKEVVAELKRLGYVVTKEGRGGGCWLTTAGQLRAAKL